VAASARFTRIPKTETLIAQGVPVEAVPTYCALTDYANNKNGLCWPKMQTLAKSLGRSVRTVQRHLHLLRELGIIEFVERRRHRGRFSSYLYRVLDIVATTGHGRRMGGGRPISISAPGCCRVLRPLGRRCPAGWLGTWPPTAP
jgi:DNA-binding transcriptional ArsR family regulator